MKFPINKDFFSKCDQIRSFLRTVLYGIYNSLCEKSPYLEFSWSVFSRVINSTTYLSLP